MLWKIMYVVYPPILRVLEALRVHRGRQDFLLGTLSRKYQAAELRKLLEANGFTPAVLAWRDTGEVFGLRKMDREVFQWHIRLFSDGEVRGHYEYASEGNPSAHVLERGFRGDDAYFRALLGDALVPNGSRWLRSASDAPTVTAESNDGARAGGTFPSHPLTLRPMADETQPVQAPVAAPATETPKVEPAAPATEQPTA